MLSPAETKALYPLMNVDDLYGTLYVPHDGTMDPAGTCTALTRAAAARGAQVPKAAWPCAPRSWPQEPQEPKERKQVPFSLLCDLGPGTASLSLLICPCKGGWCLGGCRPSFLPRGSGLARQGSPLRMSS